MSCEEVKGLDGERKAVRAITITLIENPHVLAVEPDFPRVMCTSQTPLGQERRAAFLLIELTSYLHIFCHRVQCKV